MFLARSELLYELLFAPHSHLLGCGCKMNIGYRLRFGTTSSNASDHSQEDIIVAVTEA